MKRAFILEYRWGTDRNAGKLKEIPGGSSQGEMLAEREANIRDARTRLTKHEQK